MPALPIHIVGRGDPPPFAGTAHLMIDHVADVELVILEGGMQSGLSSVAIKLTRPDGTYVLGETSLRLMAGALGALLGAAERWGEVQP